METDRLFDPDEPVYHPGHRHAAHLSPALALFAGIVVANTMGNPFEKLSREAVKTLLKIAIVGLGFGIHADKAMQAGGKGVLLTVFSIALTLTLGAFLGRKLTVDKKTSYLIASGTAICGGSAIAAVSPLVKADDSQISLALGTVFILNAAAPVHLPAHRTGPGPLASGIRNLGRHRHP